MPAPFAKSPLGGVLGIRSATFFRLDPTGTVPIATIGSLLNPFNPNAVDFDVTDTEDLERAYSITANALQDFTDASSNVHKELERATVSGTLVSSIDLGPVGSVGVTGLRADLLRIANLEAIADAREPIMFVSPRISLAKCFIESILRSWTPNMGENSSVTVSLVEARIVNPLTVLAAILDVAGSATGNNAASSVGTQSGSPVTTQATTAPTSFGLPPSVIPA